jgi:DnaJ family protein C protein 28
MTTRPQGPHHRDEPSKQPGQENRLRRWRDYVEEQIVEATERGDFNNLRGMGQPLHLEKNVHAGDKALAYSLLKNNQLAPPEIERAKEIDAQVAQAEALLASLRRRRDALRVRCGPAFASERRAYNLLRDKTQGRYREALCAINSNILSLNITAPPPMHRRMLDVDTRMDAFRAEFPPIDE